MQPANDPRVGAFFKINRWNRNSVEQLKRELLKAVSEDPEIGDASRLGLDVATEGSDVRSIRLFGSIGTERDRQRARRIVEVNTHDEVDVENDLVVE